MVAEHAQHDIQISCPSRQSWTAEQSYKVSSSAVKLPLLRSRQALGKRSSRELHKSSGTASSKMAELARRVALPGPAKHLSQLRVWVRGRSAGTCCRPQQAQQEEAEEVEEFDQIEKLQQLGINAGTQSVLAVTL